MAASPSPGSELKPKPRGTAESQGESGAAGAEVAAPADGGGRAARGAQGRAAHWNTTPRLAPRFGVPEMRNGTPGRGEKLLWSCLGVGLLERVCFCFSWLRCGGPGDFFALIHLSCPWGGIRCAGPMRPSLDGLLAVKIIQLSNSQYSPSSDISFDSTKPSKVEEGPGLSGFGYDRRWKPCLLQNRH